MNNLFIDQKLLSPYKVKSLITKKVSPLSPIEYKNCVEGCTCFYDSEAKCLNEKCKSALAVDNAFFVHKQFSISSLLCNFLKFEKNRKKLDYKVKACASASDNSSCRDFYGGQVYKEYFSRNEQEENTIDLVLYVDGFCPSNSRSRTMTMVMLSILNLDPLER